MKTSLFALATVSACLVAGNSQTVVNGDFEDLTGLTGPGNYLFGNLAGWGEVVQLISTNANPLIYSPTNGAYALDWEDSLGTSLILDQVISGFTAGQMYTLSYEVGNRGLSVAPTISIGGVSVTHTMSGIVNMAPTSFQFTATGTSQTLTVDFRGGFSSSIRGNFDNFVVTPLPIPEPNAAVLIGICAAGIAIRRRH